MKILNEYGEAWRNYLYANSNGERNDVKDFMIRLQLISDSHDQILETLLGTDPNVELIKECKDEIAFQREQLIYIVAEFIDYYFDNALKKEQVNPNDILNDLCIMGTKHILYELAEEWQTWGEKAQRISGKLNVLYGCGLDYIHDDLSKLIFKEVYEIDDITEDMK